MKKILFSVLLISCFPASLFAACEPELCNTSKGDDKIGVESLSLIDRGAGNSKCFICEEGYCADGDVVGDVNTEKFRVCKYGFNDKWEVYTPKACKDIYDQVNVMQNMQGAYKVYRLNGTEYKAETGGMGSKVVIGGQEVCYFYKCPEGTEPNAIKGACVAPVASNNTGAACTNTGGSWNGSDCTCESSKNLKQNSNKTACECTNNSYEYVSAQKKCVAKGGNGGGSGGNNGGNNGQQQQCKDSGGTWNQSIGGCSCDAEKNLVKKGNVCECKSSEYERSSDGKSCVLNDVAARKRECESAAATNSGAYWDESAKECKCRDIKKEFVSGKCEIKEAVTRCNSVTGAKWSDYNDKCVCVDDDMEIDSTGTKCVEKGAVKQEREQQARAAIISAGGVLDSIVAGFGKANVWKNAQGEFNTARLASDSIAAVVLGTAGGLITSSVMKKHQVEDGFEDLKCVIGGQPVAGWGDEFRVGIQ